MIVDLIETATPSLETLSRVIDGHSLVGQPVEEIRVTPEQQAELARIAYWGDLPASPRLNAAPALRAFGVTITVRDDIHDVLSAMLS